MRIYEIYGETHETKKYSPAVFLITGSGIYSENREIGFIKRPDLTIKILREHIEEMRKERFTVKETVTV